LIELLRVGCLLGACSFAAWRSWRHPIIFFYFAVELLATIAGSWVVNAAGDSSRVYSVIYLSFTIPIVLAALGVVWEAILGYTYRLRRMSLAVLVTLFISRSIFFGIHRTMDFNDWLMFLRAAIFYGLGFILASVSFFSGKRIDVYFILGILWMSLSAFFWAWLIEKPDAGWMESGWIVPTAFCVVAFLAVGVKMRREHG